MGARRSPVRSRFRADACRGDSDQGHSGAARPGAPTAMGLEGGTGLHGRSCGVVRAFRAGSRGWPGRTFGGNGSIRRDPNLRLSVDFQQRPAPLARGIAVRQWDGGRGAGVGLQGHYVGAHGSDPGWWLGWFLAAARWRFASPTGPDSAERLPAAHDDGTPLVRDSHHPADPLPSWPSRAARQVRTVRCALAGIFRSRPALVPHLSRPCELARIQRRPTCPIRSPLPSARLGCSAR